MTEPTDMASLRRLFRAGQAIDYVFFWGHEPGRRGVVDSACLSQWWVSPFEVRGHHYPTAEHFWHMERIDAGGGVNSVVVGAETAQPVVNAADDASRAVQDALTRDNRKKNLVQYDNRARGNIVPELPGPRLLARALAVTRSKGRSADDVRAGSQQHGRKHLGIPGWAA